MATYTRIASHIPLSGRTIRIDDVAAGDRIDMAYALGKPARKVTLFLTDAADTIQYRINGMKSIWKVVNPALVDRSCVTAFLGIENKVKVDVWSQAPSIPLYDETSDLITIEDIAIYSIEIESLSLSTGTTFTIVAS